MTCVVKEPVYYAGKPAVVTVNAAPGGYYMNPYPVPGIPFKQAKVSVKLELLDEENKVVLQSENVVNIDKPMDIAMPETTLPLGKYLLKCTVGNRGQNYVRSFVITCVNPNAAPAAASNDQWKRGKRLYERVFDSPDKMEFEEQHNGTQKDPYRKLYRMFPEMLGTHVDRNCVPARHDGQALPDGNHMAGR